MPLKNEKVSSYPMPHVMELISSGDGLKKRGSYMSHYENIKKAVEISKKRKTITNAKLNIVSGFSNSLRKEVLKQITHMLENNPDLK